MDTTGHLSPQDDTKMAHTLECHFFFFLFSRKDGEVIVTGACLYSLAGLEAAM